MKQLAGEYSEIASQENFDWIKFNEFNMTAFRFQVEDNWNPMSDRR